MQLLHTEYSRLLAQLRNARELRTDRTKVAFSVGTVFTHKKFGYRGEHCYCANAKSPKCLSSLHLHLMHALLSCSGERLHT